MTTTDNDITIDELIKYHEEKRNAFNRLLIAMQEDVEKKKTDSNVKKGQGTKGQSNNVTIQQ